MTGTDPEHGKSGAGKQGSGKQPSFDSTQPFRPPEAANAPPLPPNLPKIPGISLHYEIARGGMGVVYSGRQDFLDRRVAVKLLSVELGGEAFVQRFQREAKILAGIKHPNIVGCYMAGTTDDGQSYLVMEFIDGPSLKKWVADHGPLPVTAALRLTRAAAQALAHAYSLGIIHRDVKPENILLETVTSTALDIAFPFTPKVVDLGLARATSGNASMGLTSPGSVMGTPATMSPEQYDDPDAVDFRSDIYGLGCALYEMLVGVPAFRAKKLTEIVTQKRRPIAPDPSAENPAVPAAVGALVQEMLATQREDRPSSYKDLDERLSALLDATAALARATKVKPPVFDEGATIVSKPTSGGAPPAKPNPIFGDQPAKEAPQPAAGKTGGPGLLRTAEINFLAEGLGDVPAQSPPPSAFKSGVTPGAAAPPGTQPPAWPQTGQLPQPTAPLTVAPTPPPNPNKKKLMMIGGAIALVAVVGIGIAMSGGGKPNENGGGGPNDPPKPPPSSNRLPTVAIQGPADPKVDMRKRVTLTAAAADADGDTLSYAWKWPEDMLVVRGSSVGATIQLELIDGVPDLTDEIRVEVRDTKGGTAEAAWKFAVGVVPAEDALLGFETRGSSWRVDERRWWTPVFDQRDPHVSCRALLAKRSMSTSLGSEPYWEWFGTLASHEEPAATFAKVGLRLEFGDRAWAIMCHRSPDDETKWTVEIMEPVRSGDDWELKKLATPVALQFFEPEDTQDDYRAWFSVRRTGQQLSMQIGESRLPVNGTTEDVRQKTKPVVVDLPSGDSEPTLTLFVDKGRGLFRVYRR